MRKTPSLEHRKNLRYLKEDFDFYSRDGLEPIHYISQLVHDFLFELTKQIGPLQKYRDGLSAARLRARCLSIAIAIFSHWFKRRVETWRNRKIF